MGAHSYELSAKVGWYGYEHKARVCVDAQGYKFNAKVYGDGSGLRTKIRYV